MIVKENLFSERFGLFYTVMEADTDDDLNPPTPINSNMKVVNVSPNKRFKNYTSGIDEGDVENTDNPPMPDDDLVDDSEDTPPMPDGETEQPTPEPVDDNPPMPEEGIQDDTIPPSPDDDLVDDSEDMPPIPGDDIETEPPSPEPVDDTPPMPEGDTEMDSPAGDVPEEPDTGDDTDFNDGETGDTPPTEPDTGDGETDFTDGVDDGSDADAGAQQQTEGDDDKKGAGTDYDSTRKYLLFKNLLSLHTATATYISKMENIIHDNPSYNALITKSTEKMREINKIIYDYVTIKYKGMSYVQSLLFYQSMVASVQLVFGLLKNVKTKDEK